MPVIDLNSDLGETTNGVAVADDHAMIQLVTSANVATGFHAGDPHSIADTVRAAAERGVAVGAHIGYNDPANFGRTNMEIDPARLADEVLYQIGALEALAHRYGTEVRYVKPHGALYNTIVHHEAHAGAVVRALAELGDELPILVLPDSEIERQAAAAGIPTVREAFADRAYTPEGRLVSRREEGSVLHDPAEISARVVQMATQRTVTAIDGSTISVDAESICVHGDTPGALEIARQVSAALSEAGVEQRSFLS